MDNNLVCLPRNYSASFELNGDPLHSWEGLEFEQMNENNQRNTTRHIASAFDIEEVVPVTENSQGSGTHHHGINYNSTIQAAPSAEPSQRNANKFQRSRNFTLGSLPSSLNRSDVVSAAFADTMAPKNGSNNKNNLNGQMSANANGSLTCTNPNNVGTAPTAGMPSTKISVRSGSLANIRSHAYSAGTAPEFVNADNLSHNAMQSQYSAPQIQNLMYAATPTRLGRKSVSLSNSTPIVGNFSPQAYGNKVSKSNNYHHSDHERSRPRFSLDMAVGQNLALNPHQHSPSIQSVEQYLPDEFEEFITPLPTPGDLSQQTLTFEQSYFSPMPQWGLRENDSQNEGRNESKTENQNDRFRDLTGGFKESSQDESLKQFRIEEQHDDAVQELKKARSQVSFQSPLSQRLSNPIQFDRDDGLEVFKDFKDFNDFKNLENVSLQNFDISPDFSQPQMNMNGIQFVDMTSPSTQEVDFKTSYPTFLNLSIDLLSPHIMARRLVEKPTNTSEYHPRQIPGIDLSSVETSPIYSNTLAPTLSGAYIGTEYLDISPHGNGKFSVEKNQGKITCQPDKVDPKKKHGCPICKARFQRPEHVKRHLKSHSSEKPYLCDEPNCGKCFNRKDNLKAHLKKIHGRKS